MRVGESGSADFWGAKNSRRRDFREHLGAEHLPPAAAVATGKCNARHYKVRLGIRSWDQSYYSAKPRKPPTAKEER